MILKLLEYKEFFDLIQYSYFLLIILFKHVYTVLINFAISPISINPCRFKLFSGLLSGYIKFFKNFVFSRNDFSVTKKDCYNYTLHSILHVVYNYNR